MRRARSAHARILVSDVDTSMWDRIQPVPFDVDSSDEDMDDAECTSKSWNLRTSFHSVPYRKRLAQAFELLLVWLSRMLPFFDLDVACRCPDLVVEMLCGYIQALYNRREGITLANETVLSVQWRYRFLRRRLTGAWDMIASWRAERPLRMRVPIPLCVCDGIFRWSMLRGLTSSGLEAFTWITFAVGCRVAFWGLLRPCELSSLLRSNLKVPADWPTRDDSVYVAILRLLDPKNWKSYGKQQVCHVDHRNTVDWLQWLVLGMEACQHVFLSLVQMRKCLRIVLEALGLTELSLSLGGFRPGGASHMFQVSRNVPAIQFLGRWKQSASLTHYLQESMSMLVQCQMSDDSAELLQHLARSLSVLDAVPPHPWQHFFTRRAQRSAASARPPPPLLDGAASELVRRRATAGGRPGASSAQAGARPSLQRGVDPRQRCDVGRGEEQTQRRRASLLPAQGLREIAHRCAGLGRSPPEVLAQLTRPSADIEEHPEEIVQPAPPSRRTLHDDGRGEPRVHYIGSCDDGEGDGESSTSSGWTFSPRRSRTKDL